MGKKTRAKAPPHPDDILAGRVRFTARDIVALVHEINPTGQNLSHRETQSRYALKSQLQSLLIRKFAGELRIASGDDGHEVVLLEHVPSGRDVCHAVVAELDSDARSWVWRIIDEMSSDEGDSTSSEDRASEPPAKSEVDEDSADSLLQAAREAADAYDYELAQQLLERAWHVSGASVEVARTRLELLVDHLGQDHDALELESQLPAEARRDSLLQGFLALAAARLGERDRAVSKLTCIPSSRAADVASHLARHALACHDAATAAADIARCRELQPSHPDVAQLVAELQSLRARLRMPLEEKAARLVEAKEDSEARIVLKELLASWPDSPVGKRLVRILDERSASAAVHSACAQADFLEREERLEEALAVLLGVQQLGACAGEQASVAARVDRLAVRIRERRIENEVRSIQGLVQHQDLAAALGAWISASPEVRTAARACLPAEHVAVLEQVAKDQSTRRPAPLVAAALAILSAEQCAECDPDAVPAILEPHERLIRHIPRAARILSLAAEADRKRREDAALDTLAKLELSLTNARLDEALMLANDPVLRDVPVDLRAQLGTLRAKVEQADSIRRLAERARSLSEEPFPLTARPLIHKLIALTEGQSREEWRALAARVDDAIARAVHLDVDTTRRPLSRPDFEIVSAKEVVHFVHPNGRDYVVAHSSSKWIFVRVFDLVEQVLTRSAVFEHEFELLDYAFTDDALLLVARGGGLIELDYSTLRIRSIRQIPGCQPKAFVHPALAKIANTLGAPPPQILFLPMPDGRQAWYCERAGTNLTVRIIELEQLRVVRELSYQNELFLPHLLVGSDLVWVAMFGAFGASLRVVDERGVTVHRTDWSSWPSTMCALPDGEFLMLADGAKGRRDRWYRVERGWLRTECEAFELEGGKVLIVASDLTGRTLFMLSMPTDPPGSDGGTLSAARIEAGGALQVTYTVPSSTRRTILVQPLWGGSVSMVSRVGGEVIARQLNAVEPDVPEIQQEPPIATFPANLGFEAPCASPAGDRGRAVNHLGDRARREGSLKVFDDLFVRGSPADLADLYYACSRHGDLNATKILVKSSQKYPRDAEFRVAVARGAGSMWDWPEVLRILECVDPQYVAPELARHVCHLLGTALLMAGDEARGLHILELGLPYEGTCNLEVLLAMATPQDSPPPAALEGGWSAYSSAMRTILAKMAAADRCLEANDYRGVVSALDHYLVWEAHEVQTSARLAYACIHADPELLGIDRHRAILMLAEYCEQHAEKTHFNRREFRFGGAMWDTARLDELAVEAEGRIGGLLGQIG